MKKKRERGSEIERETKGVTDRVWKKDREQDGERLSENLGYVRSTKLMREKEITTSTINEDLIRRK